MLKQLMGQFGQRKTTKLDIIIAAVVAVTAVGHAIDVRHQYIAENDPNSTEENDQ